MGSWPIIDQKLKKYPHFDSHISAADAIALATDPQRVARHTFYPFLRYIERWNRFATKGASGKPKERPIRYAARRDSYIYSYYRHILSARYEDELTRLGLSGNVLAYRRIPVSQGLGGKCNIHFAKDAFDKIKLLGNCTVAALDISSYFECLDHSYLKKLWCRLLDVHRLPEDHFIVFERVTRYAVVDKTEAYRRLGHFGPKRALASGRIVDGYLTPHNQLPMQLCSGSDFRKIIGGGDGRPSLIEVNTNPYGIPQGSPISDLLANIYLMEFDKIVRDLVESSGGSYYRYSDDILCILNMSEKEGIDAVEQIRTHIRKFGPKLIIKEEKSSIFAFSVDGNYQKCRLVKGTQGRNGLEYLGFRFNGKGVFIRDSTLSNLYRKVTRAARRDAIRAVKRYTDKDVVELKALFDFERLAKRFGRVENFGEKQEDYRNWTFWTYARRAAEVFGGDGIGILRQLKRYRAHVINIANAEICRASKRQERSSP